MKYKEEGLKLNLSYYKCLQKVNNTRNDRGREREKRN